MNIIAGATAALLLSLAAATPARADGTGTATVTPPGGFPDRPVVWSEHDDRNVAKAPKPNHISSWDRALLLRDSMANEVDRVLSREGVRAAQDVNALDEVPCSTWFCPRNHLRPMTLAEVTAGPVVAPPQLPLRIVKGKQQGATAGFQVIDATGRKFLVKLDPVGLLGLATGPEMVGQRIFHAAGYNVPGAFLMDLDPARDLTLDPAATYLLYGVQKRPIDAELLRTALGGAALTLDGKLRVVVVPWLPGKILGGFDFIGRRPDDPNDRIAHQHRRSLRASWLLFAWISCLDPSAINTLDSYVAQDDRHFVRHYIIDFGASLGGATLRAKSPHQGTEHIMEVGRSLAAFGTLGFYRRPFQEDRAAWEASTAARPSVGWFPAESFVPESFRSHRKVPAHVRRTARDLYWGAKLVTSFSNAQIDAMASTSGLPAPEEAYVSYALKVRRDIIGRRYLRAVTAVEFPQPSPDGSAVCFRDLAVARGYALAGEVSYQIEVRDDQGPPLMAAHSRPGITGWACAPIAPDRGTADYRIVEISSHLAGSAEGAAQVAVPARIHLRWRPSESRFVVVGLERDEAQGQPAEDDSDHRFSRAVLWAPRMASKALFWPVVKTVDAYEYNNVRGWLAALLTSDDGKVGVRPELQYATSFVPTGGARAFYQRLPGPGSEINARVTAGPGALLGELGLRGPTWLGLSARGVWERRRDWLYAGIGPNTDSDLEERGEQESRYSAQGWLAEVAWTRQLHGPLSLSLTGDFLRRSYSSEEARGGPSVAQVYGLSPAACAQLRLAPGCVNPIQVPGFDEGLRLLRAGGQLTFGLGEQLRHAGGMHLVAGARYAEGIAGDPSRHVRLGSQAVVTVGGSDRALLVRLEAAMVEALGSAPVPFEELIGVAGHDGVRGYPFGRFRGESGLLGSAEYRWLISSRLDTSLFVDVGTVAGPRFDRLIDDFRLFPSVGVGLRWHNHTSPHWTAVATSGFQIAYAPGHSIRLLLSLATF